MRKSTPGRTTEEDMDKPDRGSATTPPRWVKLFGIITIVLVLLVIIIMLFSGGEHGPGRHFKSDNTNGYTPSIEQGMQQL